MTDIFRVPWSGFSDVSLTNHSGTGYATVFTIYNCTFPPHELRYIKERENEANTWISSPHFPYKPNLPSIF